MDKMDVLGGISGLSNGYGVAIDTTWKNQLRKPYGMLAHYIWIQSHTGSPVCTRAQSFNKASADAYCQIYSAKRRLPSTRCSSFDVFAFIDRLAQALKHNGTFQLAKLVPATRARRRSGP
jgi:hypothetical protein